MDIKAALARVVDHIDLSTEEMHDVMRAIMTGQCTDAQIGAFLVGLRMKGESIDEITGAAMVMRELASGTSSTNAHLAQLEKKLADAEATTEAAKAQARQAEALREAAATARDAAAAEAAAIGERLAASEARAEQLQATVAELRVEKRKTLASLHGGQAAASQLTLRLTQVRAATAAAMPAVVVRASACVGDHGASADACRRPHRVVSQGGAGDQAPGAVRGSGGGGCSRCQRRRRGR